VFKLDTEVNPNSAELYQIKSIPTLLLFKNGRVIGRMVGNAAISVLEEFVQKGIEHVEEKTDKTAESPKKE
jgi:thioredoxin 1